MPNKEPVEELCFRHSLIREFRKEYDKKYNKINKRNIDLCEKADYSLLKEINFLEIEIEPEINNVNNTKYTLYNKIEDIKKHLLDLLIK